MAQPSPHRADPGPFDIERIGAGLPALALAPQIRGWLGTCADDPRDGAAVSAPRAAAPGGTPAGAPGPGRLRGVIEAPPGTGKTTLVPPLVANLLAGLSDRPGRVVVTQPRRIAARSAARRLVALSGTRPGQLVGHTVRGDRVMGPGVRVEFATTGVLLRRLLADPELTGVDAVILDEVHERHLDSDLVFAMLHQLLQLREDLGLLAMSATLDAPRWARLLGAPEAGGASDGGAEVPAPIATVDAAIHPLEQRWAPAPGPAQDARGVTDAFLAHVASVVREQHDAAPVHAASSAPAGSASRGATSRRADPAGEAAPAGDTLVFLPGAREIERVAGRLRDLPAPVLTLTGATPAAEQDRILDPAAGGTGRIILATNLAESALTVPGVRRVVDAGLDRQPRVDTVRGMSGLVTVGASKAAMIQRAGRAAREAPGTVIRCMSEAEYAARPAETPPEITTAELTGAVLDLACWGTPDGRGLALPDPLPERTRALAHRELSALGALDEAGEATDLGRRLAAVPADPHLARGLFDGAALVGSRAAAEVVAALAGDQRAPGTDLTALLRGLHRDRDQTWRRETRRLELLLAEGDGAPDGTGTGSESGSRDVEDSSPAASGAADAATAGLVTALSFPQRIARRRPGTDREYLLASGTAAELPREAAWSGQEWLAVAEVQLVGDRALIRSAAGIDRETAELAAGCLLVTEQTGRFADGKVTAREVTRLGGIELSATPVRPSRETGRRAVAEALTREGLLSVLRPGESFEALRARLGLLRRVLGDPWPSMLADDLADTARDWLGPELEQIAEGMPTTRVDAVSALRRLLPWPEASRLEELVPERIRVPSGAAVRLSYPAPEEHDDDPDAQPAPPVLAVKLQECFGWAEGPRVVDGRVPVLLHLLSPARRPLAVTADLRSFWENAYPQVRAENRAKYRKHPWPEDPWNAVPTAKTNRRLAEG
ncbi:ATP-dependent RNA helicase [Rothia kristinae]|uniref:ATP-dependent RNA helicase n=1 Tax=Rothia kristinae TaxID=37923 RepID=UPI0009E6193B|nr:ATP-dependent helicase C-terminal domain-containing protein [Rothia kristinae]